MLLHMVGSLTHTKLIREKKRKKREILVLKICHHLLMAPPPQKFGITLLFFEEKIQQIFKKLFQMNAKSTLGWDGYRLLVLCTNLYKSTSHFELRNLPTQR